VRALLSHGLGRPDPATSLRSPHSLWR
jgi:hypothetical protein